MLFAQQFFRPAGSGSVTTQQEDALHFAARKIKFHSAVLAVAFEWTYIRLKDSAIKVGPAVTRKAIHVEVPIAIMTAMFGITPEFHNATGALAGLRTWATFDLRTAVLIPPRRNTIAISLIDTSRLAGTEGNILRSSRRLIPCSLAWKRMHNGRCWDDLPVEGEPQKTAKAFIRAHTRAV